MEAAEEIAHQIKLRDLGLIVIIFRHDFYNRRTVERDEESIRKDSQNSKLVK